MCSIVYQKSMFLRPCRRSLSRRRTTLLELAFEDRLSKAGPAARRRTSPPAFLRCTSTQVGVKLQTVDEIDTGAVKKGF